MAKNTFWNSMRARYMLPEVLVLSAVYRFRMLHRPFLKWTKGLGAERTESTHEVADYLPVARVSQAVNWLCDRTPWQSLCMVRALAAKNMLNRRGYPCTLYMGVSRDESQQMVAHAWLRCGDVYVTGGDGTGYAVTGFWGDV